MVCFGAATISCGSSDGSPQSVDRPVDGTILVHVYWDGSGLAGKRVELVEPGVESTTDKNGLARFDVPPGEYTVRAYEINHGGPGLPYYDTEVRVSAGGTVRVEIVDCLPCV